MHLCLLKCNNMKDPHSTFAYCQCYAIPIINFIWPNDHMRKQTFKKCFSVFHHSHKKADSQKPTSSVFPYVSDAIWISGGKGNYTKLLYIKFTKYVPCD